MRIALCFPRTINELHGVWPPLGILYLGTILKQEGHDVQLFDSSFDGSLEKTKKLLKQYNPDVVGIEYLISLFDNVKELVDFAGEMGATVVVGGPHATLTSQECLRNKNVDIVVLGEGEDTIVDLVSTIQKGGDLKRVKGISFKKKDEIITTEKRPPIDNLDRIPFPDRDILPTFREYLKSGATNIVTIRGCPYRCSFCYPTIPKLFGETIRFRSPENVANEIKQLHERYKIDEFFFVDDTFTVSKSWLKKFAKEIKTQKLDIKYLANARCDTFDEEMLKILKSSGCFYLAFGVESGSQEILDNLQKGITVEQIINSFILCKRYKMKTHAYLMVGSPGETSETLRQTEVLLEKIQPYTIDFNLTTPLFGTLLYDYCREYNLLNIHSPAENDCKGYFGSITPIKLENLTLGDIRLFIERIFKKRRFNLFKSHALELLEDTLAHPSPKILQKAVWRYRLYRRMKHMFG